MGEHKFAENYTSYKNKYNFTELTIPTSILEMRIIEKNNFDVSVNIYRLKKYFQPPCKSLTYEVYLLKIVYKVKQEHFYTDDTGYVRLQWQHGGSM